MAKTKTSVYKFYVVDLVRDKPATTYITIPKCRVDVDIEVTTKGVFSASDVPESAFKRLEKAAREELERYEEIIAGEAERIDKKIAALMAKPDADSQKEASALIQGMNASIRKALDSAEGAAQKAVAARLAKEAQGDKNLKEARVRTGLKWTMGAVSLTTNIAKLVVTSGADVSSYVSIAKTLYDLGSDLAQHLKNDEALRKDLVKAVQAYIKFRESSIVQAASRQNFTDLSGIDLKKPKEAVTKIYNKILAAGKEITKGKDAKALAASFVDLAVKGIKSSMSDAQTARKHYREHTTKTRHKIDAISAKAGELQKAMRSAKMLSDGVKIGAECMKVKADATAMAKTLEDREAFLDDIQALMSGNGLEIDDRTTLQKLAALDKSTIFAEGKGLVSNIKSVAGMVKEVAKAAA